MYSGLPLKGHDLAKEEGRLAGGRRGKEREHNWLGLGKGVVRFCWVLGGSRESGFWFATYGKGREHHADERLQAQSERHQDTELLPYPGRLPSANLSVQMSRRGGVNVSVPDRRERRPRQVD